MMPDRYSENSQGDFYVEYGVCTSCGAPQAEAPELIGHSEFEYGHCYFKKQPKTDREIEEAINAIAVSCVSGLRYGGTDEKIVKRLYEIGEGAQCDHKPIGEYKAIIWNNVTFVYEKTITDLARVLTTQILSSNRYLQEQIIDLKFIDNSYFEFIYRWINGLAGNIFRCYHLTENKFKVNMDVEIGGFEISMRENAMTLNNALRSDSSVSGIVWLDKDNNTYDETEFPCQSGR